MSMMIPELTVTIGAAGSGKSTWAEVQRAAAPDRVRIVNRDDIRASNGARFDQDDERIVERIRDFMIDQYLIAGYHVICSDTNLSPKVQRRLFQIAKTRNAIISTQSFTDVPLEVCLARNDIRWANGDTKVPNAAIVRMYEQFITPGAPA